MCLPRSWDLWISKNDVVGYTVESLFLDVWNVYESCVTRQAATLKQSTGQGKV